MKLNEKGFTLIEMLVSIVIFAFVMIGIYFLFDQGRWYYLASDKRANIQENGRLAMEQMERDFRMAGHGTPLGDDAGGNNFLPVIFASTINSLGFTGDIDGGAQLALYNVGTDSNDVVFVDDTSHYMDASSNNYPVVVVNNRRAWEAATVTDVVSNDNALQLSADLTAAGSFRAEKTQVFTLERVCYQLSGDPTVYPFATLQRSVATVNDPAVELDCTLGTWETIATNVFSLEYDYWNGATSVAAGSADMVDVDRITITMQLRDRKQNVGEWQTIKLHTDVTLRQKVS